MKAYVEIRELEEREIIKYRTRDRKYRIKRLKKTDVEFRELKGR